MAWKLTFLLIFFFFFCRILQRLIRKRCTGCDEGEFVCEGKYGRESGTYQRSVAWWSRWFDQSSTSITSSNAVVRRTSISWGCRCCGSLRSIGAAFSCVWTSDGHFGRCIAAQRVSPRIVFLPVSKQRKTLVSSLLNFIVFELFSTNWMFRAYFYLFNFSRVGNYVFGKSNRPIDFHIDIIAWSEMYAVRFGSAVIVRNFPFPIFSYQEFIVGIEP